MRSHNAFAVRADAGERVWCLARDLTVGARVGSLLASAVDEVFGAMEAGGDARAGTHLDLDLGPAPGGALRLVLNGVPIVRIADESAVAPTLEGTLVGYAVRTRRGCAALHASSVELHGRTVLMLGDKGSGKSTLSLYLGMQGAQYFGDEVSFVRFGDLHLEPFPKAATVKEGAFPFFPEAPTHLDPIRGPVRYFLPQSAAHAFSRAEDPVPSLLVLPRITPGLDRVNVVELDPAEAALELLRGSFGGLERDPRMLKTIARLAELPAFGLEYPDLESGAAAVAELASQAQVE